MITKHLFILIKHSQDTYIALRALIEYTNRKRLRDVSSLTVSVDAVALSGETRTLHVKNDNLAVMQFIDVSILEFFFVNYYDFSMCASLVCSENPCFVEEVHSLTTDSYGLLVMMIMIICNIFFTVFILRITMSQSFRRARYQPIPALEQTQATTIEEIPFRKHKLPKNFIS